MRSDRSILEAVAADRELLLKDAAASLQDWRQLCVSWHSRGVWAVCRNGVSDDVSVEFHESDGHYYVRLLHGRRLVAWTEFGGLVSHDAIVSAVLGYLDV